MVMPGRQGPHCNDGKRPFEVVRNGVYPRYINPRYINVTRVHPVPDNFEGPFPVVTIGIETTQRSDGIIAGGRWFES